MSAVKHPAGPSEQAAAEGFMSVGNTSAYLDLHHRFHDLLAELVPIANCSAWRTKEKTHLALEALLDRVLPGQRNKPAEPERDETSGLDR